MKKYLCLFGMLMVFITGCFDKANKEKIIKIDLDANLYEQTGFIDISDDEVNELKEKNSSFILFTYNNFCTLKIPCDKIFEKYMLENGVAFYAIPFDQFKNTYLYEYVKFAPSIIIVNKGEVVKYLNPDDKDDYDKYQDTKKFSKWINTYINVK